MSASSSPRKRLPVRPSEENLKKQAKRLSKQQHLQLSEAQHRLAAEYGCGNWAELMHVVETMNRGADQLANVKRKVEPLPQAVRARDFEKVRAILASGQFTQHDLDSGLAHAAWYGGDGPDVLNVRREIFDMLLDHGADPDGQYGSAYGPIVFGTGECLDVHGLQWLIDAGANVTFPPVDTKYGSQCALSYWLGTYVRGDNDAKHRGIEILLKHGAFIPPEVTAPILAIHRGDAKGLAELLDRDPSLVRKTFADMPYGNIELRGASLLHCAVEFDEIECCGILLDRGADANIRADVIDGVGGQTPVFHLLNTYWASHLATLEYLIRCVGTKIDLSIRATWRRFDGPRRTAVTPLEYAEETGDEGRKNRDAEIALLRSIEKRDPFQQAIAEGNLTEARRLIDSGARVRSEFADGTTPLHVAARYGPIDMVELLVRSGAKEWQLDRAGKRPIDHARQGNAPDKDRIIELLDRPVIRDPNFRAAVNAIHAGDLPTLRRLLAEHPNLVHDRAVEPDIYPNDYFRHPKLLWFVANNPILVKTLPANIIEIADAIIDAGAEPDDVNYTLELAMTGSNARKQNLQRPLMSLLLHRGATASRQAIRSTLGHGERDAIAALLDAGQPMTAEIAAGMGFVEQLASSLLPNPSRDEIHAALSLAVINRQVEAAKLCLKAGADPNRALIVHVHSVAAHQAVANDDRAMLQVLVEHGAQLDIRDTLWNGTPLDWANHLGRNAIAEMLRQHEDASRA